MDLGLTSDLWDPPVPAFPGLGLQASTAAPDF